MGFKRKVHEVAPIPARFTSESSPAELQHSLTILEWRHSLDDMTVRSMAADYLRGEQDPCNTDAFHEYEHRFGKVSKAQARRRKHSNTHKA